MDDRNLLKLFNDRVKDLAKEHNISVDEAFIRMVLILSVSYKVLEYVKTLKSKEEDQNA